jgi:hypothetical protein
MKVLIGAVAAAMVLCGSAAAQTETTPPATPPAATVQVPASRCGEFPEAPTPPDGRNVSVDNMTASMALYTRWETDHQAVLSCRRAEAEEALAISARRREEHNAGAESGRNVSSAWRVQVEAFNGRQNRRGRQ